MKKLVILSFLFAGSICFSQTVTKKYNTYTKQYEYFDDSNKMIAYEKYNSYLKQWEYYEVKKNQNQPYQYAKPEKMDVSSLGNAMSTNQNRYNENTQRAQNTVDAIINQINNLDISDSDKALIIYNFNEQINTHINSKTTNYTSTTQTNNLVRWLYDTADIIIKNVTTNINKNSTPETSDHLSKYYNTVLKVSRIIIYEEGEKFGKDDTIKDDSYIILKADEIAFKKADGEFSYRDLTNKRPNSQKRGDEYSSKWGAIFIDWDMKYIAFFDSNTMSGKSYIYYISK